MDSPLKRTPLFDAHVAAGARMVPFGGWEMPVQYTGIIEVHRTVRSAVGLFDVSVDDITLYRLGAERFMLTFNAANIDKDWAWVTEQSRQFRGAAWRNISA